MSKKATLPYDVRLECIAYVRGYQRRVCADGLTPPDYQRIWAVDYAISRCGEDIASIKIREQLVQAIIQNCQGKHKYGRCRLFIPGISERTFSRKKEQFLTDIAKYCGLV